MSPSYYLSQKSECDYLSQKSECGYIRTRLTKPRVLAGEERRSKLWQITHIYKPLGWKGNCYLMFLLLGEADLVLQMNGRVGGLAVRRLP